MKAHQIVAVLLDEGRDWSYLSKLLGHDIWELPPDVKRALEKRKAEETGEEEEPFSGMDKNKAREYYVHPPKEPSRAMQQFKSGIRDWKVSKVTPAPEPKT